MNFVLRNLTFRFAWTKVIICFIAVLWNKYYHKQSTAIYSKLSNSKFIDYHNIEDRNALLALEAGSQICGSFEKSKLMSVCILAFFHCLYFVLIKFKNQIFIVVCASPKRATNCFRII